MFCPNCGKSLSETASFCPGCGTRVQELPSAQPPPVPPQAPPPAGASSPADAPLTPIPVIPTAPLFSPVDCVSKGWNILQPQLGFFLVVTLVYAMVSAFSYPFQFLAQYFGTSGETLLALFFSLISFFVSMVVVFLVQAPLRAAMYAVAFRSMDNIPSDLGKDLFRGYRRLGQVVLLAVVAGILIGLGTAFCILPGIYFAVSYIFALPLVVDRNMGFWEAMELSRKEVGKQFMQVLLFGIILVLLNLAGTAACCIGLFITFPLTICSIAVAYTHFFERRNQLP